MKEIRLGKIGEAIRERVAFVLEFNLQDPRRSLVTITVTHVKLAKDLSRCTVFYSVLGGEKERSLAAHLLKHANGFVRSEVAKVLKTRRNPHLEFEFDDSVQKSVELSKRIDEVIKQDQEKS